MKMGRRLSRGRGISYVSIQICALLAPCRRPILIATKATLFMGRDTRRRPRIGVWAFGRARLQKSQTGFAVRKDVSVVYRLQRLTAAEPGVVHAPRLQLRTALKPLSYVGQVGTLSDLASKLSTKHHCPLRLSAACGEPRPTNSPLSLNRAIRLPSANPSFCLFTFRISTDSPSRITASAPKWRT
jgi:hypothetical protein